MQKVENKPRKQNARIKPLPGVRRVSKEPVLSANEKLRPLSVIKFPAIRVIFVIGPGA